MKIVFLDASSLGDACLDVFNEFGDFISYPLTAEEEVIDRIKDAEVVITNKVYIGKKEMDAAKNLKLIAVSATGYNNVDLDAAKRSKISVANVKGYSTESVAQLTITYILTLASSLINYNSDVKAGLWSQSPIFTMLKYPFVNLSGKKLGIIGYGTIGRRVADMAKAFGMEILVAKRPGTAYDDNNRVDFEEVLKESDFISLHCPLSESTLGLFGEKEFEMMKDSAMLINTARGPIVKEDALYTALKDKKIAGAAIDVMTSEPPKAGSNLFELPNIIITPHIAWASTQSISSLIDGIVKNIEDYKKGTLVSL